jgi:hypothetical protein
MMKILLFILLGLTTAINSYAISPPANNAISLSLGGSSATYLNSFSIENNVAALAFSKNEISLNAANRFGLSDYSNVLLTGNVSSKLANIGFSYQIAPLAHLTSQKAQLAVAKQLGKQVSAGIAINYHILSSTDAYYKTANFLTFNIGLYYAVNKKLNVGFQAFNPTRTPITDSPLERLPANIRLGLDYLLAENITLYSDVLQVSEEKIDLNAGLEISRDKYSIRGGFGLNQLVAVGFGWRADKLQLDITGAYHNQLGFSPSLNVGYAF